MTGGSFLARSFLVVRALARHHGEKEERKGVNADAHALRDVVERAVTQGAEDGGHEAQDGGAAPPRVQAPRLEDEGEGAHGDGGASEVGRGGGALGAALGGGGAVLEDGARRVEGHADGGGTHFSRICRAARPRKKRKRCVH